MSTFLVAERLALKRKYIVDMDREVNVKVDLVYNYKLKKFQVRLKQSLIFSLSFVYIQYALPKHCPVVTVQSDQRCLDFAMTVSSMLGFPSQEPQLAVLGYLVSTRAGTINQNDQHISLAYTREM